MSVNFILSLLLVLFQNNKSDVYLSVISANTQTTTSCTIQIFRNEELLIDDYKTTGNCKIRLSKGVYLLQFIKCDTTQITLKVINDVHRVGVIVNDCNN